MLEDKIAETFEEQGYIVFLRKNHCDVLAVMPRAALAYLVECKDYSLSSKQQQLAIRELNRNYTCALEILIEKRLYVNRVLRVLVAQGFAYQAKGVLQFTPEDFVNHIKGKRTVNTTDETKRNLNPTQI